MQRSEPAAHSSTTAHARTQSQVLAPADNTQQLAVDKNPNKQKLSIIGGQRLKFSTKTSCPLSLVLAAVTTTTTHFSQTIVQTGERNTTTSGRAGGRPTDRPRVSLNLIELLRQQQELTVVSCVFCSFTRSHPRGGAVYRLTQLFLRTHPQRSVSQSVSQSARQTDSQADCLTAAGARTSFILFDQIRSTWCKLNPWRLTIIRRLHSTGSAGSQGQIFESYKRGTELLSLSSLVTSEV